MKQFFLIICIFFVLITTANAEKIYKCMDSNGDTVFTSTPQDGMKCFSGESNVEPKSPNISSKTHITTKTDLVEICSDLFRELDDISAEITTLEKRRSELQREQLDIKKSELQREQIDIRQNDVQYNRNRTMYRGSRYPYPVNSVMPPIPVNPVTAEINKLSNESSILYQKKNLVYQDIGLYKCNELYNDLSKLNQKNPVMNKDSRSRSTYKYKNN